ncbi:MAG: type VII toxin-antitoxin system HepT family RNase toxin, partial [Acidobacteriota bacterium]
DQFSLPDNFAIAAYNLRSSLEAVFDICAHILSRIPGAQVEEYKQMALEMGRNGLVPQEFAGNQLYKMAGYRNRLTHLYFEVSPKEMHDIIKNNLSDFETFLRSIKKFLDS